MTASGYLLKFAYLKRDHLQVFGLHLAAAVAEFSHTKTMTAVTNPLHLRGNLRMSYSAKTTTLRTAALATMLGLAAPWSHAATVETVFAFDFDLNGAFSNVAEQVNAAKVSSVSAWTASIGTVTSQTGNPGRAANANWAASTGADQALKLSFTVDPGWTLALTSLKFDERFGGLGGGGGPQRAFTAWNFVVNGIERASGPAVLETDNTGTGTNSVDNFATVDVALASPKLSGLVEIMFTGDGPYRDGAWRFDNFALSGEFSPVPVPGAVWLMGSALVALAARRRRPG